MIVKICLLILVIFSKAEILAKENPLIRCLAKEEEKFFKEKNQGILYRLNQDFINELSTSNDITLKKNYIDEICNNPKNSPSVELLRILLIHENNIYDLSLSEVEPSLRPFKMGHINEFQRRIPTIFLQYIAGIQADMPTSNCLNKHIPEIVYFGEKLKYLEDEISTHQVLSDKKKIASIFTKLKRIDEIKKFCQNEYELKQKLKKKKKD